VLFNGLKTSITRENTSLDNAKKDKVNALEKNNTNPELLQIQEDLNKESPKLQNAQARITNAETSLEQITTQVQTSEEKVAILKNPPDPVVETPVNNTPDPVVETPVNNTPDPVVETPVNNTPDPVVETPVNNTPDPVVETPVNNTADETVNVLGQVADVLDTLGNEGITAPVVLLPITTLTDDEVDTLLDPNA
jgi:hypothetical protein